MDVNRECRVLDKRTGANYYGVIDTEFEGLDFYNLVEIPDDGKNYAYQDGTVVETVLDITELKKQGIAYLSKRILEYKSKELELSLTVADGRTITVLTDLKDNTLSQWLIVKNKIPRDLTDELGNIIVSNVRYVQVLNKDTLLQEFIPLKEDEILRLNTYLTNLVDTVTHTIVNITNLISSAPDDLVISVYNMTDYDRELYIQKIITENTPVY